MDEDVGGDVVCLNDEFDAMDGTEKRICLFGDAECQPVDVESGEYDAIPDRPPEEWYERYCLHDDLTPECQDLHDKARDFYNKKQLRRSHVQVKVSESDGTDDVIETESVVRRNAQWFREMDVKMGKFDGIRRCAPNVRVNKQRTGRVRGRLPKQNSISSAPSKRGRGRPSKKSDVLVASKNVMIGSNSNKHARSCDIVPLYFFASELCGGCCQNIGRKFGLDVKSRVLRLKCVMGDVAIASEVVKCSHGRPRKVCAPN